MNLAEMIARAEEIANDTSCTDDCREDHKHLVQHLRELVTLKAEMESLEKEIDRMYLISCEDEMQYSKGARFVLSLLQQKLRRSRQCDSPQH